MLASTFTLLARINYPFYVLMLVRADDKDLKRRKRYMQRCFTIYEEIILWWFSVYLVKVSKSFQYQKDIHVISSTYLFNSTCRKRYFH